MTNAMIGLIGGSGLYQMEGLQDVREHRVDTPYGPPSGALITGRIDGIPVAFLSRHGHGHRLIPSEIPYRANIYALKQFGVRYLLSFSAVGSLCENMAPLDFVLPDQFIDLTRSRANTFFGKGAVAHVAMAQPVCSAVVTMVQQAIDIVGSDARICVHDRGTYVCIEGPQFSTCAESNWYRTMGAHIIGMTNMPEAKLAREAQIAYATVAMVTDYDCWHPGEGTVTANLALANLRKNAERAQKIAAQAVKLLHECKPESAAHTALQSALVTPIETMDEQWRSRIQLLMR